MPKPPPSRTHLKVRIPLIFEAEGEGLAPIFCVVGLCAMALVFGFLVISR